jgi:hypothetical protein
MPFILTLTPQYVVRATGKTFFTDIQEYAEQNAAVAVVRGSPALAAASRVIA